MKENELLTPPGNWQQEKCGVVSDTCPSLPCGQRCLYKYKADESTESKVSGVHLTPAKHYSDSFNFQLAPTADNAGCKVKVRGSLPVAWVGHGLLQVGMVVVQETIGQL